MAMTTSSTSIECVIHSSTQHRQQQKQRSSNNEIMEINGNLNLIEPGGLLLLMDIVANAASVVNKVLLENCGICTVYCDQQVQYEEWVQQHHKCHVRTSSSINHALTQRMTDLDTTAGAYRNCRDDDIKQYQELLFDEESVLESVESRDAGEEHL
ncbi:hypothetical protein IV203_015932 [Nitzschia inconspicua]|uniref:Uncharacterized protein n=1 Tax=Nitzschia inconspicua TaxID=303405 RepID=A0A9K3K4Q0_9STRA|nr:hypothetical protein IV203_025041 [Nitzschia inconspicua]KAG7359343.1 hypothetical protein IV203_015932 [Nitzschia inconspicua]